MKGKITFFKKLVKSIYDIDAFSQYAREGIKKSIIYLILISIIAGGIKGLILGYDFSKSMKEINNIIADSKYNMYIENGILNADNTPITVKEENDLILYIDENNEIEDDKNLKNVFDDNDKSVCILKDGIVIYDFAEKYKVKYDTIFKSNMIRNSDMLEHTRYLVNLFYVSYVSIGIINVGMSLIVNCLIVVAASSIVSMFMKMVVKYSALFSITIYASTLPLIVVTILQIIKPDVNFDVTFIGGTLTYVVLILKHIKLDIIKRLGKRVI